MPKNVPYHKKPHQESKRGVFQRTLKRSKKAPYQEFTQNTL